jgi:iron complex outermembrane recepter protein
MIRRIPTKTIWLAGVAAAGLLLAQPAFAQDVAGDQDKPGQDAPAAPTAEAESPAVDELVVTARRRTEVLQDVPIAVTAITGEQLSNIGAVDITTLQQTTPNSTVQVARGSNSTLISFIRGVGQQDPLWGFEPGVGLYVDDIYVARPQAAVLDIYDVERIEVLRGPQGTLYGRNTIGGAIKYVTADIEETEAKVRAEYGSYNEFNLVVAGKVRFNDMWAGGITVARFQRDGYGENLTTGAEHYNKDVWAARGTLEFRPRDDLFFRLSADIVQDDSNPRHGHREVPALTFPSGAPLPGGGVLEDVYDTRAGAGDENRVEARGVSFLAQWEVNDQLTLKSISAYRSGETETVIDFDTEPQPFLDIPASYADHQFTQEFQALYTGERVQGVVGVFYLSATAAGIFDTIIGNAGIVTATSGYIDTTSWAVFGDLSYDVTEQLSVSVGGRYTRDTKSGEVFRADYLGAFRSPLTGGPARNFFRLRTDPALYQGRELEFEQFTPRLSVTYEFNPDLTTYAAYSKGFKSGGFDMRGDFILYPGTINGFQPETVDSYEVGLKGSLLDKRLSFATALFYSQYKDQQVTTQYQAGGAVASVVDNVGQSTIWGWEFEGTARLTDWISLRTSIGYTNAEFDEFLAFIPGAPGNGQACAPNPPSPPVPAGCFVDVSAQRAFQNTPEWNGNVSLPMTWELGERGYLTFTPSASYRGEFQMFETPSPLDQEGYWLVDASLVWTSPNDRYRVALHGRNLTDERYRIGGYFFPGALLANSVNAFYGPPRTFTVSLQATF